MFIYIHKYMYYVPWKCLAIHLMTTLVRFYWTSFKRSLLTFPHEWLLKTGLTTLIPLLLKILSSKSQYYYIIIFFNHKNSSLEISEQFGSMLELLHKKSWTITAESLHKKIEHITGENSTLKRNQKSIDIVPHYHCT